MSHHNYPNHGRFRQSPTGGDSGSSYSELGRTTLPPLTIAFPTSDSPVSNNYPSGHPTAQRSTPVPYEPPYYPPAQQQRQTHSPYPMYPAYRQLSDSDARYHSGHGQYYPSHTDLQMPPASSDMPPPDPSYHSIRHQLYDHAPQNALVPPTPGHSRPEGHREDTPLPVGVAGPGRVQDPHRIDMAHQGIVDYHPQPPADPAYIFPEVGRAQGIQAQVQPNALVNQERDLFPTPNQPRPEDLRRLASRYWYHPDAQVGMVSVEKCTTGQYQVVITLKTPIGF